MKKLRISVIIMALLAIVALSGCGAASSYIASTIVDTVISPQNEVRGEIETSGTAQFTQGEVLADLELALSGIYAEVNPSVVSIQVVQRVTVPDVSQLPGMFFNMPNNQVPQEQYQQGAGSGFVWSKDGYIVTNHHVVDGAEKIEVQFYDGDVVTAEFIGSDPDSDLAVLKVDVPERDLYPVVLADAEAVSAGQLAVAIGNPFGLENTMTVGFISAIGRSLSVDSEQGATYSIPNIIQTDAPINPGNSGGVLVNRKGEVVGVTTAIISPVEASVGIGFAIPSDIVANVVPALIENGAYEHAWLGISGMSLTLDIAKEMSLDESQRGALVIDVVPGGPSEAAGIEGSSSQVTIDGQVYRVGGDVIVEINGDEVLEFDDLIAYLSKYKAGDTIEITLLRDGQERDIAVTLGKRPTSNNAMAQFETQQESSSPAWIGITGLDLISDIATVMGLPEDLKGVLIEQVVAGGPADQAGLRGSYKPVTIQGEEILVGGDIIIAWEEQAVTSMEQLQELVGASRAGEKVRLTVLRGGKQGFITVTLGDSENF